MQRLWIVVPVVLACTPSPSPKLGAPRGPGGDGEYPGGRLPPADPAPLPIEGVVPVTSADLEPAECADSTGICNDQCWCWEHPLPQGNDLGAATMSASPAGGFWALLRNTSRRDPGKPQVLRFSPTPALLPLAMDPLWVSSADEIWGAVRPISPADRPAVIRWDGARETRFPLEPGTTGTPNVFGPLALSGSSPSDAWALVETVHGIARKYLMHWDGTAWAVVDTPLPVNLSNVWALRPDDVWVGIEGVLGGLLHFDGTSWTRYAAGLSGTHVYGVKSGETWFFGWSKALRFQDGRWTPYATGLVDDPTGVARDLHASWGASSEDVWSVGDLGAIIHWNGATWEVVDSPTSASLHGITGSSSDDIWATGDRGTILHYDGTRWALASGGGGDLNAVWGTDDESEAWAVGSQVLRRQGGAWRLELTPARPLRGIWGTGPRDVWAVGDGGLILHRDGTGWTAWTSPRASSGEAIDLEDVWGADGSDVWAVGSIRGPTGWRGAVLHWDGAAWALASETPDGLSVVAGSSRDDVWATSFSHGVHPVHWNGSAWQVDRSLHPGDGIWVRSSADVWTFDGHVISHWDGQRATVWGAPIHEHLGRASKGSAGWVSGALQGTDLVTFDGGLWRASQTPSLRALRAVWVGSAGTVIAVGEGGAILRRAVR